MITFKLNSTEKELTLLAYFLAFEKACVCYTTTLHKMRADAFVSTALAGFNALLTDGM
jgi:hypothetical protein